MTLLGRSPLRPGATLIGIYATLWWNAARLVWLARNGEEPAKENEVSERGFKLTLAVVGFAAAVGQWERFVRFRDLCLLDGQPQSYRAMEGDHNV